MHLNGLTWEEVRDSLGEHDALILPAGICEQHGTHLPLGTDTLTAEYVAERVSERTGVLIAPTLNYGVGLPCDHVFPGSTSVRAVSLRGIVSALARWWTRQGFRHILVLTAHGDPFHLDALRRAAPSVQVRDLYDIPLDDILTHQHAPRHACEAETSVILHLAPEAVRLDRVQDFQTPFEAFRPYLCHQRRSPIPGSPGCQGFPSAATAEKGRRILERMVDSTVEWVAGITAG